MNRHVLKLILFLLLLFSGGAIINIAVAWLAAYLMLEPSLLSTVRELTNEEAAALWDPHAPGEWNDSSWRTIIATPAEDPDGLANYHLHPVEGVAELWYAVRMTGPGFTSHDIIVTPQGAMAPGAGVVYSTVALSKVASGFPFRCFEGWLSYDSRSGDIASRGGVMLKSGSQFRRRNGGEASHGFYFIPYIPIISGFTANTLFWGLALYIPILFHRTLRRYFRRTAGRCVYCGYDLRFSSSNASSIRCTECGRPMKRKIATQKAETA